MDEPTRKHNLNTNFFLDYYTLVFQVWDMDKCLQRPLLAVCPEKQRLKVNLHHTIPLLIREADLMAKMDLPIPTIALTLYAKQNHFNFVKDSLQFFINDFLKIVKNVKLELRPLFLPHLVKLANIIAPGMKELNWVSSDWKEYVDNANGAVEKFKVLTERVHDIYTNRVLDVLHSMQSVDLYSLPEPTEDPWTVEYFCEKINYMCRSAAEELHKKSLMIEEAVEEILMLVRKARIECPSTSQEELLFEGTRL